MATNKHIDKICLAAAFLALLLACVFLNAERLGLTGGGKTMGYESRLFDTAEVHTIDLQMDGWEDFLATCEDETYSPCTVVIDGEQYANVGIRAKGNTSLRSVAALGSQRYSFKLEFDQYDSGLSYYGLDKLCLNNLIQDNTCMKDYLTYQLMNQFGAAGPLCSYVYITVNGEDWGLYLAVEGLEEGFLQRSYGSDYGELYKPDSMDLDNGQGGGMQPAGEGFGGLTHGEMPAEMPGEMPAEMPAEGQHADNAAPGEARAAQDGPGGGMNASSDVKLQYIDDDPDSYPNIFDNAKTDVTAADQARLIASLASLSRYENLEEVLDVDAVLRYFVVHNFVVNGDSYTGSLVHNYYLYEKDGQLSMLPWDYNLAFGGFGTGDAASAVNDPIDEVLEDRPMQAWIFSDQAYTQQYHDLYTAFLQSVDIDALIQQTARLIAPYVEQDPTKFCTYEEFQTGVEALQTFCALRVQSVQGQLNGTVPSTTQGQADAPEALISAGELSLSAMGDSSSTGGFGRGQERSGQMAPGGVQRLAAEGQGVSDAPADGQFPTEEPAAAENAQPPTEEPAAENGSPMEGRGQRPAADSGQAFGEGGTAPEGQAAPDAAQEAEHQPDRAVEAFGPMGFQPQEDTANTTLILLGASAAVLAVGLVVAFRFRK